MTRPGEWKVSVNVQASEKLGKKKLSQIATKQEDTLELTNESDPNYVCTSVPASKVVSEPAVRSHSYVARLPRSMKQSTAQVVLHKPYIVGSSGTSQKTLLPSITKDEVLRMTKTVLISKTTTSLREIALGEKRELVRPEELPPKDLAESRVPSFFPIEYFDDQTFERGDPNVWSLIGEGNTIAGKSLWHLGDGTSEWRDVEVLAFNTEDGTFQLKWVHNGARKWSSRLNVCFEHEDLELHIRRRQQALNNRTRVEAIMRYERLVDTLPTERQLQLPPLQFQRIIRRIGMPVTGELLGRNQQLVDDVLLNFCRTMNKLEYDNSHRGEDPSKFVDPIEVHGREELPVQLIRIPGKGVISIVPLLVQESPEGAVVTSHEQASDFRQVVDEVGRGLSWSPPQMLQAVFAFQTQIARLKELSFLWDCSETVSVELFMERHRACWTRSFSELTTSIMESMSDAVLLAFTSEERALGHAIRADQRAKYDRVVDLGNKMLRDAVRDAIAKDIEAYSRKMDTFSRAMRPTAEDEPKSLDDDGEEKSQILVTAAAQTVTGSSESQAGDSDHEESSARLGGNWFGEEEILPTDLALGVRSLFKPIFHVELKYSSDSQLALEPNIERISNVAVAAISELLVAAQNISCLHVEVINARPAATHLEPCAGLYFEQFVQKCIDRVQRSVEDNAFGALALVRGFSEYPHLVETDVDKHASDWPEGAHTLSATKQEIERFTIAADQMERRFANQIVLRMHLVTCWQTKTKLVQKAIRLKQLMLTRIEAETREQNLAMIASFSGILDKLQESPENPEQLAILQEYVKTCSQEVDELALEIAKAREKIEILEAFAYEVAAEDFSLYWTAYGKPREIGLVRDAAVHKLQDDKVKFMGKLTESTNEFHKELLSIDSDIKAFFVYSDIEQSEEYYGQVTILNEKLREASETAILIKSREKLFETGQQSSFDEIDSMIQIFKPYAELWTIAAEFQKSYPNWMYGPFVSLDSETINSNVDAWWKFAWRAEKTFEGKEAPKSVAALLKEKLDGFKPNLPLISALRNPGMSDRHWTKLSTEVGIDIIPDNNLTLKFLLESEVNRFETFITTLSEQAAKEYGFERTLEKMKSDWKSLEFEFQEYKDSGTFVLKGIEETVMLLDDQIVKVQAMRGSPYAKPLESVVMEWSNRLVYMQDTLDLWLKCQKTWLYLEPIFSSPDITRQMPKESRLFQKVDQMWRQTMQTGADSPAVMQVMSIENLQNHFFEANKNLDLVQKGLNDYLETKRGAFPRFYFLSNDELLDILSETKDPRRVVPHMPKCFEAICGVNMRGVTAADQEKGGEMLDITEMISGEGEIVPLTKDCPVQPDAEKNRGNVERWLLEMEQSMRLSLKQIGRSAIAAYKSEARTAFVQRWTGMIVLATDCLHWTKDVEDAMNSRGIDGVVSVEKQMIQELKDIVELVRGELSKQARLIIGALVVLDVHNKDVTSLLVQRGVSSPADFDWNSQLRYYQESIEAELNIMTRMMNASLPYSYEYLGNSTRLVVTPLTDRCYRTLMGALHLSLGGAPEGPAGTGKTETVKDLSKAVAKQCVVFNCSDGLDYLAMAKFFKGLASCGAWACFDEFNRIDLEVLSVIAQQILTLSDGLRRGLKRIFFEGSDIPLVKGFSSFITMNPGYAGRSELPDNLKALFRPCAMMVPDYAMISEICLYSYGFTDARDLARKLVKSLQISSEQLSSQVHYDFGMRAVKSILTAAGQLKRSFVQQREDDLVLRAINDVNLPKFTDADLPLFKGITSDLFLGLVLQEPDYALLIDGMMAACKQLIGKATTSYSVSSTNTHSMNVQPTDQLLKKCVQLYETVTVRHSLMVVGLAMSMKTTVFKVLQYGMCNVTDKSRFEDVIMFSLNPKSITIDQIYGNFDPNTREWVEGIGASLTRRCTQMDSDPQMKIKRKWILFDGPVDAIWIENMNTVMDDNKKLCLNSGEIIKLTSTITMMFEPEDLAAASPATVSRNGMVLMEPQMLRWESIFESWIELLPSSLESAKPQLKKLFDYFLPSLLRLIKKECREHVQTKETELVHNLLKLFNSHLAEFKDDDAVKGIGSGDLVKRVDGGFLFSLIWSVGCTTDESGRARFNEKIRELLSADGSPKITVTIPEKMTVYDFAWDRYKGKWIGWLETIPPFSISVSAKFQDILVPTVDTIRLVEVTGFVRIT